MGQETLRERLKTHGPNPKGFPRLAQFPERARFSAGNENQAVKKPLGFEFSDSLLEVFTQLSWTKVGFYP